MDDEVKTLLFAAEGALDVGNKESAARMLRKVLEHDARNAKAWHMLSRALEEHVDQVICLKNALALDPDDLQAADRLDDLQAQGVTTYMWTGKPTVELLPELRDQEMSGYGAGVPLEQYGVDPLDDPLQCPYCGEVNPIERETCIKCGKDIVFPEPRAERPSSNLRLAVFVAGVAAMFGIFEIGTGALWHTYSTAKPGSWFDLGLGGALDGAGGEFLFGGLPPEDLGQTAAAVVILGVARIAVMAGAWFGAYNRWNWGYYAAMAVSVADIFVQLAIVGLELGGTLVAVLAAIMSISAAILLFTARVTDFTVVKVRAATVANPKAASAGAFYRQGMRAKKMDMWALAVANWRKAVGAAPMEAEYYRWLGLGYMRLERYDRAVPVLEEGRRIQPENAEFDELLGLIHDIMAEGDRKKFEEIIVPLWESDS